METRLKTVDDLGTGELPAASAMQQILRRIEAEYREMPGMCVTAPQAQRLWGLDSPTCAFVLRTLVNQRILRRTVRDTYVKC
jgi:hypothetical protein